jgi:regulator of protease activity HflC (stomatin/prohibitin superfamily)
MTKGGKMIAVIILVILIIALVATNIRVVPQAHSFVVERLGAYKETWDVGLHIKVPFIDRVARQVDLKEQYCDFPPQPVITQDNVTMQIDSIVFFRISDPMAYAYGVRNPIGAIENLTATTLRNVIGSLTLDETLTSRDQINAQMQDALDIATDPWGIKITRVELKNINPPEQIRDAMEKQMKAEREKREKILFAEGEKQSQITVAEGEKQSKILQAEADKQATILKAEAEKEKQIREAEGRAEAIRSVQKANADGIAMLKEAGADESVLTIKSLEAFEKAANGQATKIIVPSSIAGVAGLAESIKEVVKN